MQKGCYISFLICCLFCCTVWAAEPKQPLTIVYNKGIAPIKFTTDTGNPSGILNEYWQLLAEKANLEFRFLEVDNFDQSLEMVKNGEADLHAGIFHTDERSRFLAFSKPVLDLKYYIYSSPDVPTFASLTETKGYLLGVVQGGYTEDYIKKVIPKTHLLIYDDFSSLFKAVLAGDIKVFVASDIHLNYYLAANTLANPFQHTDSALYNQTYYGATTKANQPLIETIIAAQALLSPDDVLQLRNRWIRAKVDDVIPPKIKTLSPEELAWINTHPVIRVSNEMDWPPFDFNQDGEPLGLSIDLLNMIAARVGLQLDYRSGYSWNELQDMLRRKELDVLHSLTSSAERTGFMLFTKPYIANQTVLITASHNTDIHDVADLEGKTIAVIKGYYQQQVLSKRLDNAHFLYVNSPLEALKAVSSGRADATIRFHGVANYLINHHFLTNLKFVNEFKIEENNQHELSFGVRNDWPVLHSILQKGLEAISREEMDQLRQKWITRGATPQPVKVALTDTEKQWLNEHPEITLGADYKWPPFDFADQEGLHSGLAADYIRLIAQRTGLNITVRTGVWADILQQMQNGKLDGLACAVKTVERTAYLDFSRPYLKVPTVIIVNNDNHSIRDIRDLYGKTVSINKGSYMHDWMAARYPQIRLHLSTSNESSIEAVSYGEADAYIGNLAVANYIIRQRMLPNLNVVKRLDGMTTEIAVATGKEQPLLLSIIQKALDTITDQERQAILDKWYLASKEPQAVLTRQEKEWLQQHPVIRVSGAPDWAPVSYSDEEGNYTGIVAEYLKKLEDIGGLKFETVPADTWGNALQMLQNGQADIINAISKVDDRGDIVDFTDSYMQAEAVLITRDDIQFLKGLEQIDNQQLGTVSNFVIADYLRKDYPFLPLHLYANAAAGLQALSRGEIDIFVVDIPTFEYYSRTLSLANLKISGVTPYVFQIAFGVAKDTPELVSILNKTLGLINQKEKNDIYGNWVAQQKPLIDYSLIWKIVAAASLFLLMMLYWNRRLTHEVLLRKQAEDIALQASRAKSDFLANMSHEIRTPMNSVLGFAELLDNMIRDPEQKSYLKSIRTGGKALLEIINDILDLSKIEAGKMTLKPVAFSLAGLFVEMDEFFRARMTQKNLQFYTHLPDSFPAYFKMDPVRLRQVLINLIGNALKFTENGSIRLECHDVEIDEEKQAIDFTISVTDTGIGIPPEQHDEIFNQFEQQEGLDNARYGGTGLGLSICRSLTRLMGGTISVKSSPGKGSQFSVVFTNIPLVRESAVQEPLDHIRLSQFRPANILIADDVQDNRKLVIGHFKGSAIRFHEAENGREALNILLQNHIDMVLLDLRMPEMNGYETITAMKQTEPLQQIPVVAFTASVMGEDLEKVSQYGFDSYLRKPVSRQELLKAVARFLPLAEPDLQTVADTAVIAPHDVALPQLQEFLAIIEAEFLPVWQTIKDKGDFDLISQFAANLYEQAATYSIGAMVDFAERLQEYAASYDIIEVDSMMKQFPAVISAMQQQLSPVGGEDEKQV